MDYSILHTVTNYVNVGEEEVSLLWQLVVEVRSGLPVIAVGVEIMLNRIVGQFKGQGNSVRLWIDWT